MLQMTQQAGRMTEQLSDILSSLKHLVELSYYSHSEGFTANLFIAFICAIKETLHLLNLFYASTLRLTLV